MARKKIYASTTARVRAHRARQADRGLQRFELSLDRRIIEQIERLRRESPVFRDCSMSMTLAALVIDGVNQYVSSNDSSDSGNDTGSVSGNI